MSSGQDKGPTPKFVVQDGVGETGNNLRSWDKPHFERVPLAEALSAYTGSYSTGDATTYYS